MKKVIEILRLILLLVLGVVSTFTVFAWASKILPNGGSLPSYFFFVLIFVGLISGGILWRKTKSIVPIIGLFVFNLISHILFILIKSNFFNK